MPGELTRWDLPAGIGMSEFEGFSAADFAAFEEAKWGSHAFNRERLEVKLKLQSLGKALRERLAAELSGQEMGITEERPSVFNQQRVRDMTLFFLRDDKARRVLDGILDRRLSIAENLSDPALSHRHIYLGARVFSGGLRGGLFLHRDAWADIENLLRRLKELYEGEKLEAMLSGIPEGIRFGHTGSTGEPPPARTVRADTVTETLRACPEEIAFFADLPAADPRLTGPGTVEWLTGIFQALAPLRAHIAWRKDNDFFALTKTLQQEEKKAELGFTNIKAGDAVRIKTGVAAGRIGRVEALERKGLLKVRVGQLVVAIQVEDVSRP